MTLRVRNGEYRINMKGGTEATAYYTDDRQDALDTAKLIWSEHEKNRLSSRALPDRAETHPRRYVGQTSPFRGQINFYELMDDAGPFKAGDVLPISEEATESLYANVEIPEPDGRRGA